MKSHHPILLALGAVALLTSCDDRPPIPTDLSRHHTLVRSDVAVDSTGIPPEGPYVAVDVGTFGGQVAKANAVNNAGAVVGQMEDNGGVTHAFLWHDGIVQDLGTLGGTFGQAIAINDAGEVLGTSTTQGGSREVVVWNGGIPQDLGPLQGTALPHLNQEGDVTWTGPTPTGPHAFLWQNGTVQDLGTLGGATSTAGGINDAGQVVGSSSTGTQTDVFVWTNGTMQDVPSPVPGASFSPVAINNRGWVTGTIRISGLNPWQKAFLWNGQSVMEIPVFGGSDTNAVGLAITESGDVYGFDFNLGGDARHPFVWAHGNLLPLNPARADQLVLAVNQQGIATGWEFVGPAERAIVIDHGSSWNLGVFAGGRGAESQGLALNSQGDVVGFSLAADGKTHAALWQRTR